MLLINPLLSPRSSTIAGLLSQYRLSISREASRVLEERDSAWRRENDVLHAKHVQLCRRREEDLVVAKSMKDELDWFSNRNRALEDKVSELVDVEKANVLMERTIVNLKKEKSRLEEEVKDKIKRMEEEMKETTCRLSEKSAENERILDEKIALEDLKIRMEAELKEKRRAEAYCVNEENSKLAHKIEVLERDKGVLEAQLSNKEMAWNCVTLGMQKVKKALEDEKRRLEEEKDGKIFELEKRTVVLEVQVCKAKKDLNNASDRISELLQRNDLLHKEKSEVEDEVRRLKSAVKVNEFRRVSNDRLAALEAKKTELCRKISVLEEEKGGMEVDICKKNTEIEGILKEKMALENQNKILEEEKGVMEADFQKTISEKSAENERVLNEKVDLEILKNSVEAELKEEICQLIDRMRVLEERKRRAEECVNEDNSKLVHRIEVLEREKAGLEDEVHKAKTDMSNESDMVVEVKKALEVQMKRAEEAEKRVSEISEIMRDLERAKEALEYIVLSINRDKCEEIERILHEKKTMERIEVLEREKKEMESKFCQADKEKSEEIQRILNENTTMEAEKKVMKVDYEKKNLELADRISILERDKRVFYEGLEDVKREMEMEINGWASKSKEDMQLFQSLHLKDNIGMLSAPWQNEGKNMSGVACCCEHGGSVNHNADNSDGKSEDGMTRTSACKRKRSIRKCEELGKKIQRSTGVVDDKPVLVPCEKNGAKTKAACMWKGDQDLLDAFDVNPELCLKAVCALYRQHKRLKRRNASLSPGVRVFKRGYSSKAKSLATFIIDEVSVDSRMKKVVDKLDKIDVSAVGVCRNIAKEHYKQVFEIYKKKEDRLFLS